MLSVYRSCQASQAAVPTHTLKTKKEVVKDDKILSDD